jgi:hypothetical protein
MPQNQTTEQMSMFKCIVLVVFPINENADVGHKTERCNMARGTINKSLCTVIRGERNKYKMIWPLKWI